MHVNRSRTAMFHESGGDGCADPRRLATAAALWNSGVVTAALLILALQAATSGGDVVVTARRPADPAAEQAQVRAVSAPTSGQLARFRDPLCIAIVGLAPATAQAVRTRIATVARTVRAPVAGGDCSPNALVVVAGDAAGFVADARRTHADWFAGLDRGELAALAAPVDGAYVWSATGVRNEDGLSIVLPVAGRRGDLSDVPILRVKTASFLNPHTQQSIQASFAVIGAPATTGRTVVQLADYLAMRLLAKTRPLRSGDGSPTILTLFDPVGGAAPAALTRFDEAYLRGLYAGSADRSVVVQQRAIGKALARAPAD